MLILIVFFLRLTIYWHDEKLIRLLLKKNQLQGTRHELMFSTLIMQSLCLRGNSAGSKNFYEMGFWIFTNQHKIKQLWFDERPHVKCKLSRHKKKLLMKVRETASESRD